MCEKHNRTCPGYRNIVDLMFRDESEHVIWKANKPRARGPRRSSASPTSGTKRKNKKQEQRKARSAAGGSVSPAATAVTAGSPVTQSPWLSSNGTTPGSATRQYGEHLSPSDINIELPEASLQGLSIMTPVSTDSGGYFTHGSIADDSSDDEDLFLPSPDDGTWPSSPSPAPDYTLSPIFQEQGMAFFFSRYVAAAQENVGHNNYDFIYDIWKPKRNSHNAQIDAVLASMVAVGLAAMSMLTCSPERLDWARQSYVTALRLTNDALMDPKEAIKDSTLLAVLILGTYEMLVGPNPDTMSAWRGHMRGAAALASLRGPDQFRTKAGIRMFLMLCETLTINCVHEDEPMPQSLVELRNMLGTMSTPLNSTWNMASSPYKLLQVRHDIKSGLVGDTQAIVNSLLVADEEYVALVAGIPDSWQYTVLRFDRPNPAVFGQACHAYPSLENATTWNSLRMLRLLVHETILSELYKSFQGRKSDTVPMEYKVQFARSWRLINQLRDALIASVPQYFGIVSSSDAKSGVSDAESNLFGSPSVTATSDAVYRVVSAPVSIFSPASPSPSPSSATSFKHDRPGNPEFLTLFDFLGSSTDTDTEALFMSLTSASHPLVWPLYLIGMSSSCIPPVRSYVVERLTALHIETGLAQARRVAEVVAAREGGALGGVCGIEGLPDVSREPMPVRV